MPAYLISKTICVAFLSGILSLTSCVIGLSVSPDVDNVSSFSWSFLWAYFEWQRGVEGRTDKAKQVQSWLIALCILSKFSSALVYFSLAANFLTRENFVRMGDVSSAAAPLSCSGLLGEGPQGTVEVWLLWYHCCFFNYLIKVSMVLSQAA